jgi:hypothetical protein
MRTRDPDETGRLYYAINPYEDDWARHFSLKLIYAGCDKLGGIGVRGQAPLMCCSTSTARFVVDPDGGHWVRFVATRVQPSAKKPRGPDHSLTLHGPDSERLAGFDNGDPMARQKRGEPQGHRHRVARLGHDMELSD